MYSCILAGGDNNGLIFEQPGVGNYHGDYNLFHNDNPDRAINVAFEDEFSLSDIQSGAWTTYSGQDAHSLIATSASDVFHDAVNFDLHLLAGSPARDNGTATNAPDHDYEGNPRPSGSGYDIGAYEWQISGIETDTGFGEKLLRAFTLAQNYPNPFNPSTTIEFTVPEGDESPEGTAVPVSLRIYTLRGELVRTLISGDVGPGRHTVQWDGKTDRGESVPSGIYLYRLDAGGTSSMRKMIVVK